MLWTQPMIVGINPLPNKQINFLFYKYIMALDADPYVQLPKRLQQMNFHPAELSAAIERYRPRIAKDRETRRTIENTPISDDLYALALENDLALALTVRSWLTHYQFENLCDWVVDMAMGNKLELAAHVGDVLCLVNPRRPNTARISRLCAAYADKLLNAAKLLVPHLRPTSEELVKGGRALALRRAIADEISRVHVLLAARWLKPVLPLQQTSRGLAGMVRERNKKAIYRLSGALVGMERDKPDALGRVSLDMLPLW